VHGRLVARPAVLTLATAELTAQVSAALAEDIGSGDVTAALVPPDQRVEGSVRCRERAVLCGAAWAAETFRQLASRVTLQWLAQDGDFLVADQEFLQIAGPARAVLTGERTALNFLQTLSATATAAKQYVDAVAGTGCTILDTRKTLPGLRIAQKYATRCGGARNHRIGLYDMVLIKENHIVAAGSIAAAVDAARRTAHGIPVEVEVETLAEFDLALAAGVDVIMLDELSLVDMREAVRRNREAGRPTKLEASGNVSMQTVRAIAETGVDFISIGSITKHVRAVDLSMRLKFRS
jgi:nicotinate-nucleotide pyrophosphorylase (carboxylating)